SHCGGSLTDWQTLPGSGNMSQSGITVSINANNQTLQCYDLSLHGGAQVVLQSVTGTIIQYNNFKYGATLAGASSSALLGGSGTGLTFLYNVVDGNGPTLGSSAAPQSSLIAGSICGTHTYQYNWFLNQNQHTFEINCSAASLTMHIDYNLISHP